MSLLRWYFLRMVLLAGLLQATEISCIAVITHHLQTTVNGLFAAPIATLLPWLLAASVAAFLVYCGGVVFLERRPLYELAMRPAIFNLTLGVGAGVITFAAVFGAIALAASVTYQGYSGMARIPAAGLIFSVGVVFEELIFRGAILRVAEQSLGTAAALLLSAAVFAASHLGNTEITVLSAATLLAGGMSLGLAYVLSRSLWLPIGAHLGWNFTMGALFGTAVSGHPASGAFKFSLAGNKWVTGGAFGPESSIYSLCFLALLATFLGSLAYHREDWVSRRFHMRQTLAEVDYRDTTQLRAGLR